MFNESDCNAMHVLLFTFGLHLNICQMTQKLNRNQIKII